MDNLSRFQYYSQKGETLEIELNKIKKKSFMIYFLRLFSFLGFAVLSIVFILSGYNYYFLIVSILLLFIFLYAIQKDFLLNSKRKLVEAEIIIINNELKYLNHQYNEFDGGEKFTEKNPHLAGDFDLFGNGSIYQYFNRCVTRQGCELFSDFLSFPEKNSLKIIEKQEVIKELSEKINFITKFRANGLTYNNQNDDNEGFNQWINEPNESIKTLKIISRVYPVLFLSQILLIGLAIIPFETIMIPLLFSFYIVYYHYRQRIDKAHNQLSKSGKTFKKYAILIGLIEKEIFHSQKLIELQNRLQNSNEKASKIINSLYRLIERFDLRNNMLIKFLFNSLFLFDLYIYQQLFNWKTKQKDKVSDWFNVLSEIDVMTSFAVFAFNCKNQVSYPEISTESFVFEALELGHPLIPVSERINNNIKFSGKPSVIIITGANMAGKSTFLKSLTVNLILAMNGSPVCAKHLIFKPCDIMSNINIRDSLKQKTSYFYAELKRIREIIDHVTKEPDTLVILDEILRGTNTKDKQTGSFGLLEKLITLNANAVIATHDLIIGELDKKYPDIVINHCFESELENDELIFDYKLKNGISKKLNASFLMKKMGVIE